MGNGESISGLLATQGNGGICVSGGGGAGGESKQVSIVCCLGPLGNSLNSPLPSPPPCPLLQQCSKEDGRLLLADLRAELFLNPPSPLSPRTAAMLRGGRAASAGGPEGGVHR